MSHAPVMLAEMLAALDPKPGEAYLDATFGGGGYARAILAACDCTLTAIDRDPEAIARAASLGEGSGGRFTAIEGRFGDLGAVFGAGPRFDGIVFDLGVSSFQLDEAERGFSFRFDGPLDMRMGKSGRSAADAVNALSEAALADVIYHLGEEPGARRIARAIAMERKTAAIETTAALAGLVERALGGRRGAKIHPATKTFQALRMLVNDELGELARGLCAAEALLKPGGRIVIVAFHSLEDRLAKAFLAERAGVRDHGSRHVPPGEAARAASFALIARRAVPPGPAEIAQNPRARSAKLRWAIRTHDPAWPELAEDPLPRAALEAWEALA